MVVLFKAKVRSVGTSLGVIIPKDAKVRKGEIISFSIIRRDPKAFEKLLKAALGSAKGTSKFVREHDDREF